MTISVEEEAILAILAISVKDSWRQNKKIK